MLTMLKTMLNMKTNVHANHNEAIYKQGSSYYFNNILYKILYIFTYFFLSNYHNLGHHVLPTGHGKDLLVISAMHRMRHNMKDTLCLDQVVV